MHIMMLWLPLLLCASLVSGKRLKGPGYKRAKNPKFVSAVGGNFHVNGSAFKFVGTNAYWLHTLNTDKDIDDTFASIKASNISVVRTWAFNDVHEIPTNGTWFQSIVNGTVSINNDTNGLPRLDKVVEFAEKHGIYLLLSLTNNWNPLPGLDDNATIPTMSRRDVTPGTGNTINRNVLSNDYGGMDAYVRQHGKSLHHDEFYTDEKIISLFKNYTTNVVSRYVNSPAVFGWELANDPRCNSTLASTNGCTAQTVTKWHSTLAKHVSSVDPNHIVSSGNHGFFCTDCPKLFPRPPPPPPPAPAPGPPGAPPARPSNASGQRRRKLPPALTKKNLIKERVEKRKQTREQLKRSGGLEQGGVRIRGRWAASPTRRQDSGLGFAYDGSQGVDSEDILGIPQIGFSSFQLFPDQNSYSPDDPNLPAFNNTVQAGLDWIKKQAEAAQLYGKPITLTGFGLVSQSHAPNFVPFNSTTVANGTNTTTASPNGPSNSTSYSDDQRNDAYQQWLQQGIDSGLNGMLQYQWGQNNLTSSTGTTISPNATGQSPNNPGSGQSPNQNETGVSPDDGYSLSGASDDSAQQIISTASQQIGQDA